MGRSTAKNPSGRSGKPSDKSGKELRKSADSDLSAAETLAASVDTEPTPPRRGGGWREIEARREKAALKASLADVWDEDFDLDDEILAELDHTAEFFTTQEDPEEEVFEDEVDEVDEYFEDDEV